ncbi:MAG: hypothetical protein AUI33_09735 [Ignavibacteria bacterium 13_1_40CM_2_61_4]|nr:MAG: hypothetical protein AUI33_09735 [Ignavibacteria bacterium 13_1_40CM_2_61_4]
MPVHGGTSIVRRSNLKCVRLLTAILAAFTVSMLGVTGYEHDGVEVSVGEHSGTCNLATIIDRLAIRQPKVGTGWHEIVQVHY